MQCDTSDVPKKHVVTSWLIDFDQFAKTVCHEIHMLQIPPWDLFGVLEVRDINSSKSPHEGLVVDVTQKLVDSDKGSQTEVHIEVLSSPNVNQAFQPFFWDLRVRNS